VAEVEYKYRFKLCNGFVQLGAATSALFQPFQVGGACLSFRLFLIDRGFSLAAHGKFRFSGCVCTLGQQVINGTGGTAPSKQLGEPLPRQRGLSPHGDFEKMTGNSYAPD